MFYHYRIEPSALPYLIYALQENDLDYYVVNPYNEREKGEDGCYTEGKVIIGSHSDEHKIGQLMNILKGKYPGIDFSFCYQKIKTYTGKALKERRKQQKRIIPASSR